MGMWACEEVEPQAERTAARAIFVLCVLGALAACIVALVSVSAPWEEKLYHDIAAFLRFFLPCICDL